MKLNFLLSSLLCLSSSVHSFPTVLEGPLGQALASRLSAKLSSAVAKRAEKRLLFDPLTTPIEVTGDHEFIPPNFANGDQRGPCPGLNALANHGYIGRNGVATLVQATEAINEVFGMGLDLGGLLAVMGTVFVGNPLSLEPGFSIGGEAPGAHNILGDLFGLLGTPRGLNGSHNIIEGDSSNTRADFYMTGDASTMVLQQFQDFFEMSDGEGDYNMDLLAARAALRFNDTVSTNPMFYYGPYTGMIARNAGYIFPGRMFANFSHENTEGVLNKKTLMSLYAVEEVNGTLVYNRGYERIPENWYRRPVDYSLIDLNLDVVDWVLKYPELGSIGGNMGSVDSFAGLDLGDVTGGVLNLPKLLEGNNLLCFVFEVIKTVAPNSLSTLFKIIEVPLKLVTDILGTALLDVTCPAFADLTAGGKTLQEGVADLFPGANLTGSIL
ncbi:Oxidase [Pleurostoma richardsiae]|uniref:Oxidase n=1 Tax=Pleurostoma richardsiae TaxID=41990 RepID=A0AA38RAU6_9PEZI|nr:Oxidase [Pleurostoma richardsiae]